MPPPMGVVSGPLMPTKNSRKASTVSSGSQELNWVNDFSPAKTSIQAIFFLPPDDLATAASMTRTEARQMSAPVPSPSMNGTMGRSGTCNLPLEMEILSPAGTLLILYDMEAPGKRRHLE